MEVRDATEGDLPAIVRIYNATIPGRMVTADTVPVTTAQRLPWFHAHAPDRRPLWVACADDGTLIAWLSFQSFYGRPAYDGTAEVSVYVDAAHHRRGLGRLLLERAITRAPALRLTTLLGFIFSHNQPSLRLFAALGFETWGVLPNIANLDGVERSLTIVGRRVGA